MPTKPLRESQVEVLRVLARAADDLKAADVAGALGADPSSVRERLVRLERKGLVQRTWRNEPYAPYRYRLTPSGRALLEGKEQ